jgi:hypothetical protein
MHMSSQRGGVERVDGAPRGVEGEHSRVWGGCTAKVAHPSSRKRTSPYLLAQRVLMRRKVVLAPTWRWYLLLVGAWLMRITTSCESIAFPANQGQGLRSTARCECDDGALSGLSVRIQPAVGGVHTSVLTIHCLTAAIDDSSFRLQRGWEGKRRTEGGVHEGAAAAYDGARGEVVSVEHGHGGVGEALDVLELLMHLHRPRRTSPHTGAEQSW